MRSDATRNHETILSAAIAVLADAPGASMREIADASGTGRTTLYRHFPDREALVTAIFQRVYAEAEAAIERALDGARGRDPAAVLADLGAELAGYGDRYRFLQTHAPAPEDAAPPLTGARGRLMRFLTDSQRAGRIRDDLSAEWLIDAMWALVDRAARRAGEDPGRRAQTVRATLRSLFAAPGAAAQREASASAVGVSPPIR